MKTGFFLFLVPVMLFYTHCESQKSQQNLEVEEKPIVIYSTDLSAPPGDPDDHFDLLSLFSIPEIDIKAVILDYPHLQRDRDRGRLPNFNAVKNAAKLFDRKEVPCAAGIRVDLQSPEDQAINLPEEQQKAIQLVLSVLQSSPQSSVTIITVGSLRDIAAAYNRDPDLFHDKIKKLIISVGDSYGLTGTKDTNTSRGVNAWKRLMTSGLPIDWMPTNPSKGRGGPSPYVSYWYFMQHELAPYCQPSIAEFLLSDGIDLHQKDRGDGRPIQRHMWSTPAFIEVAGLKCNRHNDSLSWISGNKAEEGAKILQPYTFVPISFYLDENGIARWEKAVDGADSNIRIFKINDYYLYNQAMFQFLSQQFGM